MLISEIIGHFYLITWDRPSSYKRMVSALSSLGRFSSISTKTSCILFPRATVSRSLVKARVAHHLDPRRGRAVIADAKDGTVRYLNNKNLSPNWRRISGYRFLVSWDNPIPATSTTMIATLQGLGIYRPVATQTTGLLKTKPTFNSVTLLRNVQAHLNRRSGRAVIMNFPAREVWQVDQSMRRGWIRVY